MGKIPAYRMTKPRTYQRVSEAVERGCAYGVARAFKHNDNPSCDTIVENVEREIMNGLCEILIFEKGDRL